MRRLLVALFIVALLASPCFADKSVFNKCGSGAKSVTTPGTAVQLSSTSQGCGLVYISSKNLISHDIVTNPIYIGGPSVSAGGPGGDKVARNGILVASDDVLFLPVADLSMIWVDSAFSQDGVTYMYLQ